jgi:hypothetical protein
MSSITPPSKILIGHPTFSRSIESHGSAHSSDTNYHGWRRAGTIGSEDVGTQTECMGVSGGSVSSSGRTLIGELRKRREDTIVDISLESMKYNGGNFIKEKKINSPIFCLRIAFKKIEFHSRAKKSKFYFFCPIIDEFAY